MYRITEEEVAEVQKEFKKNYQPFVRFSPGVNTINKLGTSFCQLLETQNGMDTDDYSIGDNNKVEKYFSHIENRQDKRILILGTGTGRELQVAKELGFNVFGTTLGSRNIQFARDYLNWVYPRIQECCNEDLPLSNDLFDIVTGFQVFEHTISPLLFLLEQRRVLKMNGLLLLEWPPASQYSMGANPHHQICFCPGQAEVLFQKAGFGNIKLFYEDNTIIPEEDKWRCDLNKMMCISGIKLPTTENYITKLSNS